MNKYCTRSEYPYIVGGAGTKDNLGHHLGSYSKPFSLVFAAHLYRNLCGESPKEKLYSGKNKQGERVALLTATMEHWNSSKHQNKLSKAGLYFNHSGWWNNSKLLFFRSNSNLIVTLSNFALLLIKISFRLLLVFSDMRTLFCYVKLVFFVF